MARQTTITLDEDVAARLATEAQKTGTAPQQLANEMLRRELPTENPPKREFVVRARDLGVRPGVDFDCAWKLLHDLDETESK